MLLFKNLSIFGVFLQEHLHCTVESCVDLIASLPPKKTGLLDEIKQLFLGLNLGEINKPEF